LVLVAATVVAVVAVAERSFSVLLLYFVGGGSVSGADVGPKFVDYFVWFAYADVVVVVDSFDKNSDYLFVDVDERTVGNFGGNLRCLTVGKEVECVCVDTGLVGACGNATVNSTVGEDGTDSIVNVDD
jgi:hypothetical protein